MTGWFSQKMILCQRLRVGLCCWPTEQSAGARSDPFYSAMYNLHPCHHGYSVYEAIGQGLGWLGYEPNGYPQNRPSCNLIIKILLCSCSSLMNIHMKSKHLYTLLIQRALPIYLFPKPILLSFSSNYVLSKSLPIQSNHKPAAQKSV